MQPKRKTLLTIVGPTAIGKTRMAIALATHFGTEILSCDSRQFFKELRIGTAVPSAEELMAAPHHFIQHKSIFEAYSVGDFERDAIALLDKLFKKHDVVVMVGGSGLYAKAIIDGLDDFPEVDEVIRQELNEAYAQKGIEYLQELLKTLDEVQYNQMDVQNPQRLIRALEVCRASGKPYSSFLQRKEKQRDFTSVQIGLTADRTEVYERINKRVDMMLEEGLLIEAQNMMPYKHLNALQTVGYKELFSFFEGECSFEAAIEAIKMNTRRFADKRIKWFDYRSSLEEVVLGI